MMSRQILLLLLAMYVPVAGQTGTDQHPEHTSDSLQTYIWSHFPLWIPPGALTPSIEHENLTPFTVSRPKTSPKIRYQQWLGMGMAVVCSVLSYYYHQEAETTYEKYQTSGDPAELDKLFRQTKHLDRLAGWFFLSAETGLLLVTFSVILAP